jgi:hypothetical protein
MAPAKSAENTRRGNLERFLAKHALGLDPGVDAGSREETASKQKIRAGSDSIRTDKALVVEPQQVVLGEAEAADWDFIIDAGMRAMPIVGMQPVGQERASLI